MTVTNQSQSPDTILSALIETLESREKNYDHPLRNFNRISLLTRVLDELPPSEEKEALHQILVKVARLINALQTGQPQDDSWIDIAGYAVCGLRCHQANNATQREIQQSLEPDYNECDADEFKTKSLHRTVINLEAFLRP